MQCLYIHHDMQIHSHTCAHVDALTTRAGVLQCLWAISPSTSRRQRCAHSCRTVGPSRPSVGASKVAFCVCACVCMYVCMCTCMFLFSCVAMRVWMCSQRSCMYVMHISHVGRCEQIFCSTNTWREYTFLGRHVRARVCVHAHMHICSLTQAALASNTVTCMARDVHDDRHVLAACICTELTNTHTHTHTLQRALSKVSYTSNSKYLRCVPAKKS